LHAYFKVDGISQGFPAFSIHANNANSCKTRFDWVTVKDNNNFHPCQVCCLWEFCASIRGKTKSVLLFSAIKTKNFNRRQKVCLFQRKCYDLYGRQNLFRVVTDLVDSIIAPCYIVPTTLKSEDYFEVLACNRPEVFFYYIPYEFFFRDDWGETSVNILKTKDDTILNSKALRLFSTNEISRKNDSNEVKALTMRKRKRMTNDILNSIQANENSYQDDDDENIILEGTLRAR